MSLKISYKIMHLISFIQIIHLISFIPLVHFIQIIHLVLFVQIVNLISFIQIIYLISFIQNIHLIFLILPIERSTNKLALIQPYMRFLCLWVPSRASLAKTRPQPARQKVRPPPLKINTCSTFRGTVISTYGIKLSEKQIPAEIS